LLQSGMNGEVKKQKEGDPPQFMQYG
jgi:hypothetical protein